MDTMMGAAGEDNGRPRSAKEGMITVGLEKLEGITLD
jgi:hypothetical protein